MKRINSVVKGGYGPNGGGKRKKKGTPIYKKKKPIYNCTDPNGDKNAHAPFYDPYSLHMCVWRNGTIGSDSENGHIKFYAKKRVKYVGNHCIICHKVGNKLTTGVSIGKPEDSDRVRRNMINAMMELRNEDDEIIINTPIKKEWIKFKPVFDDLILPDTDCVFYWRDIGEALGSDKKGKILIQNSLTKMVIIEEFDTGFYYHVIPSRVFPVYGKYNEKSNLYAIGNIPKSDYPYKVFLWKQKWKNFQLWTSTVERLKYILKEQCEYRQSFYVDELPGNDVYGPITYKNYKNIKMLEFKDSINKKGLHSYSGYYSSLNKKSIPELIDNFCKDKRVKNIYEACKFLIPTDGIFNNYFIVDKNNNKYKPHREINDRELLNKIRDLKLN